MITLPLFILATVTLLLLSIHTPTPYWVMTIFGLAGIAGSAIDYRNGCGVSAVAVGVNSAWLSGYAVFVLEAASHHNWGNDSLFLLLLCAVTGIGFIGNGVILTYILRPFRDGRGRTIDTALLVFLAFMTGGLAFFSIISALANLHLHWVPGVMFSAALLAELSGIVLAFVRVLQASGSEGACAGGLGRRDQAPDQSRILLWDTTAHALTRRPGSVHRTGLPSSSPSRSTRHSTLGFAQSHGLRPSRVSGGLLSREAQRKPLAMLACPARRRAPMARLPVD